MADSLPDLLGQLCAGDLDEAGRSALDARLRSDPAALAAALAEWRLHRQLPLALRGSDQDWFAAGVASAIRGSARRPALRRMRRRASASGAGRRWWPWVALAASLAVALLTLRTLSPAGPAAPPGLTVSGSGRLVAAGRDWRLDQGRVELVAAPRAAAEALTIHTPHGSVTVVGTRFSLAVTNVQTRVEVGEGRVRVGARGETRMVLGGEALVLDQAGLPPAPPVAWRLALPSGPEPAWRGRWTAEGVASIGNPDFPGDAMIMSPRIASGPVLATDRPLVVEYRSLAATARPGALWILIGCPDGREVACQAEFLFLPGIQARTCTLTAFQVKDAATDTATLAGARLLGCGLLGWSAGTADLVLLGLRQEGSR